MPRESAEPRSPYRGALLSPWTSAPATRVSVAAQRRQHGAPSERPVDGTDRHCCVLARLAPPPRADAGKVEHNPREKNKTCFNMPDFLLQHSRATEAFATGNGSAIPDANPKKQPVADREHSSSGEAPAYVDKNGGRSHPTVHDVSVGGVSALHPPHDGLRHTKQVQHVERLLLRALELLALLRE